MDYISRDILIRNIESDTRTILFCKEDALKYARNALAADVAPVRHGRWVSNSIAIVCSECGRAFNLVEMFAHYCPWCGAKMDGKEDRHD